MIKNEDKVVTLAQAKKLASLGVEVETQFLWMRADWFPDLWKVVQYDNTNLKHSSEVYRAPDVAELGILLNPFQVVYDSRSDGWYIYVDRELGHPRAMHIETYRAPEAQARGEALIWLIESEFLLLKDLNSLDN